jgi:hypothetical protein
MGRDHHSETQVVETSSRYSLHVEIRKKLREKEQRKGPLTTDEIAAAQNRWFEIAQGDEELNCPFALKKDDVGLWGYHGRVASYHPVFIPRKHPLVEVIIEHYHKGPCTGSTATLC